MNGVVINNLKRTKFYGYCDVVGKRCTYWEIEFPKSELDKLEPVVRKGGKVKLKNEDGSNEEWDCPPLTYVKNHRFVCNDGHCDIFTGIGFRKNEKGEEVCYTTAFFPIPYRRYRKGDTIRVTGEQGNLFSRCFGSLELNKGLKLGVECVLDIGEDDQGDVVLPRGILDGHIYISAKCIELIQAVEDKPLVVEDKTPTVKYFVHGPDDHLYTIDDSKSKDEIARIWYDPRKLPGEVVHAFVEDIKDIVTKRKTNNSKKEMETNNSITEDKKTDDEFESKFGYFEQRFSTMYDPHPDEIRDFITTIILAAAHDSSLVDASFKWLASRNKQN